MAQKEFAQQYPRQGWVEHDAMEIWSSEYAVMMEVLAKQMFQPGISQPSASPISGNHGAVGPETGRPIYNAIVWQCRRTSGLVDDLLAQGYGDHIRKTTGLVPDAYFSATKIKWILDHVEGAGHGRRGKSFSARWTPGFSGN